MAKLYFKFGAMGGGKTLDCIRTYYNYKERFMTARMYKTSLDTRSDHKITSRTGDSVDCENIAPSDNIFELFKPYNSTNTDVIIIDESQFLTSQQVQDLKDFALDLDIPIICYGLLNDFMTHLFEGSKRLIEIADKKDEIKSICWCGKLATQNARVITQTLDGKEVKTVVKDGEIYQVGGNESYVPLCYYHYREGMLSKHE